jgi:hypothetical protein
MKERLKFTAIYTITALAYWIFFYSVESRKVEVPYNVSEMIGIGW